MELLIRAQLPSARHIPGIYSGEDTWSPAAAGKRVWRSTVSHKRLFPPPHHCGQPRRGTFPAFPHSSSWQHVVRKDEGGHRPGEIPELILEQGSINDSHVPAVPHCGKSLSGLRLFLLFFFPAHGMLPGLVLVINTLTQNLHI